MVLFYFYFFFSGHLCQELKKVTMLEEMVRSRLMYFQIQQKPFCNASNISTIRRDAGEADDLREREKPRLDDAQVGHWCRWQEQGVDQQQIRLGAIAFGLGTLIYTGLEFVHFFEVTSEHIP